MQKKQISTWKLFQRWHQMPINVFTWEKRE